MIKKTSSYLIFITSMMFCVMQAVFAEFTIEVVNESGKAYRNIELVITAVGFDAMYGRISLGEIGSERTPKRFTCKYEYLKLPLTGVGMPSSLEECNLDMMVIASSKLASGILTNTFEGIVQPPQTKQIAYEENPRKFPIQPPMQGLCPPDTIKIIIKGISFENPKGIIEAEFD